MNREPPEFKLPKHRFSNARTPFNFLVSSFFCSICSMFLLLSDFSLLIFLFPFGLFCF